MNKNNAKKQLKYIGYYQIIGGLIGLLFIILNNGFDLLQRGPKGIFIFSFSVLLYFFSMYCGYLLFKEKNKSGISYSIINNLIQVLSFSIFGITYNYASGLQIGFTLDLTEDVIVGIQFWTSDLEIGMSKNTNVLWIGFNVIALFIIFRLFKIKESLKL